MYKLKSGYEGKSRITTSEYYLLPFGERMHYEFEDEGNITNQSTGFPYDEPPLEEEAETYFPQETSDNESDNDSKFSGFGGGDFGGGGSSDSFETPDSSSDNSSSSDD